METFSTPEINVITSSLGYSIKILGRVGLEYVEDGRVLSIDSEALVSDAFLLYQGSVRDVEEQDRVRIIANIRRALAFINYALHVV